MHPQPQLQQNLGGVQVGHLYRRPILSTTRFSPRAGRACQDRGVAEGCAPSCGQSRVQRVEGLGGSKDGLATQATIPASWVLLVWSLQGGFRGVQLLHCHCMRYLQ